ncbi:30S ribosomal protein S12 methylthiotransferase RimO [Oscillospiraceae bacterium MB08-C2-2]|nr:30S ribosomal protein S12 methylthiotransferase RimO [Oscillospiraceae bacterium MB08-C2-2]
MTTHTAPTIGMVSLGCSKNQVDAERILGLLRADGFEIISDAASCDAVIINTCGFIDDAKKESIEAILEFARMKESGKVKAVVVTGCLAERYREEVAKELPEADVVVGIGKNSEIAQIIRRALGGERVLAFGDKNDLALSGERVLTNAPYFAYLKVAEGCDNCCTYCAIPLIRGHFRSRPMEDVLEEARQLAQWGVQEINVVAQDTTRYGQDIYGKLILPELLEKLCEIPGFRWVRILYCYPERVTEELLQVMKRQPKIVNYMDIPIQHCSGKILSQMNRRDNRETLTALMKRVREVLPDVTLRTTLITGFPGETEEDYTELCDFVEEIGFERLGCFTYSQEEGTVAGGREDQLEDEVKRRRAEGIMERQMVIAARHNETCIGRILEVLNEGYDTEMQSWYGRSPMDAPDIDTRVYFTTHRKPAIGEFVQVRITDSMDYDLVGEELGINLQ